MAEWKSISVNVGPTLFAGQVRGHWLFGDVPEQLGGHDSALIPPEGILVSLGNCMGMEIALACKAHGIPYMGMRVQVEAQWEEKAHFLHDLQMQVQMPETLNDHDRRVVEAAADMCTVRNTLERGATVALKISD